MHNENRSGLTCRKWAWVSDSWTSLNIASDGERAQTAEKNALSAKKQQKRHILSDEEIFNENFLPKPPLAVRSSAPSLHQWPPECRKERQATMANSAIMAPSRFRSMGLVIFAIKLKRAMIAKENKIQKSPRSWQKNQNKQNLDSPSTAMYTYCWQHSIHCLIDKFAV